jgi:excinuclease UvrABC ATPase subunit
MDKIIIKGAKENNLKNISLELPRNKFIVFTGVSGSGKTSLAFDTIYAHFRLTGLFFSSFLLYPQCINLTILYGYFIQFF